MKIRFFDEQNRVPITGAVGRAVEKALSLLAMEEGVDFCLNIQWSDDEGIRALNKEFRRRDSATDVLSFPAYELEKPLKDYGGMLEVEEEEGLIFIGDVAISMERAQLQAEEYGHSLTREAAFLALHGALHLLGYDHADEAGEAQMTEKQRDLLEKAGIGRESDG